MTGDGLINLEIVCNIYRPPPVLNCDYKQCIDEFASLLSQIDFIKSEVIIAGYVNIKLPKINEKDYYSKLYDTITGFSFFPKITFPNRFTSRNGTLIENLFCKNSKVMLESI